MHRGADRIGERKQPFVDLAIEGDEVAAVESRILA
jgi:hypothetical protein